MFCKTQQGNVLWPFIFGFENCLSSNGSTKSHNFCLIMAPFLPWLWLLPFLYWIVSRLCKRQKYKYKYTIKNPNLRSNSFDQLREATLASLDEPQPRVRARHRTLAYGVDELDLDKWVASPLTSMLSTSPKSLQYHQDTTTLPGVDELNLDKWVFEVPLYLDLDIVSTFACGVNELNLNKWVASSLAKLDLLNWISISVD